MSVTLVQQAGNAGSSSTGITVTISAASVNNYLVVFVNNNGTPPTVSSISCTNVSFSRLCGDSSIHNAEIWYGKVSGGSSGTSVAVSMSGGGFIGISAIVAEFTGIISASPSDGGGGNGGAGTAASASFTSTSQDLILACVGAAGGGTPISSPGGIFTDLTQSNASNANMLASYGTASAGSQSASWTLGFSVGWGAAIGGLKVIVTTPKTQTGKANIKNTTPKTQTGKSNIILPIHLVQQANGSGTTGPLSISISAAAVGDTIVVFGSSDGTVSSVSCTNVTFSQLQSAAGPQQGSIWAGAVSGSPSGTTVTVNFSGASECSAIVAEFTGVAKVSPSDGGTSATGSGSSYPQSDASGSFTSTQQDLIVACDAFSNGGVTVSTPPSGYTTLTSVSRLFAAYKVANAGSQSATWSVSGSGSNGWSTVIAGLKPATTTTSQTQPGKSRIKVTTPQTQTGKSRIKTSGVPKTQTGKADIKNTTLKTQTGKANVALPHTSKTQTGKASIKNTTLQTQTGKGRVAHAGVQQTQTGKGRITAHTPKTQTGKASIKNTTLRTQTGKARIDDAGVQKTITGKSRIKATTPRTQAGHASIKNTVKKTVAGKAHVSFRLYDWRIKNHQIQSTQFANRVKMLGAYIGTDELVSVANDSASQTALGKIIVATVADRSITTQAALDLAASIELSKRAYQNQITFECDGNAFSDLDGRLEVGQLIHIDSTNAGITGDFVIQSLQLQQASPDWTVYTVQCGDYLGDLQERIRELTRIINPVSIPAVPPPDDSVGTDQLEDDAVTQLKIAAAAVGTAELAVAAVTDSILAASAVTNTKIADNAISTPKLQTGSITSGTIAAGAIVSGKIAAGAVTAGTIAAGSITAAQGVFAAAAIVNADITSLSASKLTAGTIDASVITVTNLNASNITTGTMSANKLSAGTIDASVITVSNLNASNITTGTMSANKLSAGTIDASVITVTNLNASNITSGTMSASKLSAGTISASISITSPTITSTSGSNVISLGVTAGVFDVVGSVAKTRITQGEIACTVTGSSEKLFISGATLTITNTSGVDVGTFDVFGTSNSGRLIVYNSSGTERARLAMDGSGNGLAQFNGGSNYALWTGSNAKKAAWGFGTMSSGHMSIATGLSVAESAFACNEPGGTGFASEYACVNSFSGGTVNFASSNTSSTGIYLWVAFGTA